ncbi:HEAT repeat domain-containing protein [Pseudomonas sp. gcc21]|uniref:HEAT repeat domain-containing protein n=1 Tax=Pseudomonas sp. gcc21 TaxID=2726989 RepID=UPI0014529B86|nr:HEAT repeat domain-containing protein [Pseudomonas sp. gcc21]QJD57898.1 HEAT repeat domain-containing protein [Pseudomonas sp. gcc21]
MKVRLLSSGALILSAVVIEVGGWTHLGLTPELADGLRYFLLLHSLACVLLATGLWQVLPARYQRPLPWAPLLLFSLAFFIPGLGALGILLALMPALWRQRRRENQAWRALSAPQLPFRPSAQQLSPLFNDGSLHDVVKLAPDPEQRLAALLATRRMVGKSAVSILKLALRDPIDDVRLLAYSMLDQQETQINERIEALLTRLTTADDSQKAALHAALARWYWELSYLGLAQGSVLQHVLMQARNHLETALESSPNPELELLGARIALEQGLPYDAKLFLRRAEQGGISTEKLTPFRAEAAFLSAEYAEVPGLLVSLSSDVLRRPPFTELARYWI